MKLQVRTIISDVMLPINLNIVHFYTVPTRRTSVSIESMSSQLCRDCSTVGKKSCRRQEVMSFNKGLFRYVSSK